MAKKLYVGNLPYTTTNDELRDIFVEFGSVDSASVVMDKMTGRSRGFGFVEMTNDAEADAAIEAVNGRDAGGRALVVNEARPMSDRPMRNGGGRSGNGRPMRREF